MKIYILYAVARGEDVTSVATLGVFSSEEKAIEAYNEAKYSGDKRMEGVYCWDVWYKEYALDGDISYDDI